MNDTRYAVALLREANPVPDGSTGLDERAEADLRRICANPGAATAGGPQQVTSEVVSQTDTSWVAADG